jgi:hypothetical protein
MSKVVLKFVLSRRHGRIAMPFGAKIIFVAHQAGRQLEDQVAIWAECPAERSKPDEQREFRVLGTGEYIDEAWQHVGSAIAGIYVWHVYEKPRG